MKIIAPWREWDLKSRTDCMEYAAKHDIPVVATKKTSVLHGPKRMAFVP